MRKTLIVASVLAAAGVMAAEANALQRVVSITPSNRQCFTIDDVSGLLP